MRKEGPSVTYLANSWETRANRVDRLLVGTVTRDITNLARAAGRGQTAGGARGKTLLSAEVVRLGLARVGGERWIRGAYRGEGGKEREKDDRSSHLLEV